LAEPRTKKPRRRDLTDCRDKLNLGLGKTVLLEEAGAEQKKTLAAK